MPRSTPERRRGMAARLSLEETRDIVREKGGCQMPKLFRTDISSEADLKVFVTDIRSEADLVVYETTNEWDAAESQIWFYTDIRNEADKIVCFTDIQSEADLVIYKTDVQSDACWMNSAKSDLL
jgi:hypothetical protein